MRITGRTRLAGIMAWPIAHSRSPALHNFWLDEHGIDGVYVPLAVRPELLEQALRALPALGFRGCNLTIPHKQAALAIVDQIEPLARRIGAVNTVIVTADGQLEGRNTDVYGFCESLRINVVRWFRLRLIAEIKVIRALGNLRISGTYPRGFLRRSDVWFQFLHHLRELRNI